MSDSIRSCRTMRRRSARGARLQAALAAGLVVWTSWCAGADSRPFSVELTDTADSSAWPCRAQGARNTCSLFAITSLVEFELRSQQRESALQPGLSEEFLAWAANDATGRHGDQAMFYEAIFGLNARGICRAPLMPYAAAESTERVPSEAARDDAGQFCGRWTPHWIKRWDVSTPLDDRQLDEIRNALAAGHPVACGLRWPRALRGSVLMDVPPPRRVFDGHSISFIGFSDDSSQPGGGVFRFRNSAGPEWGDQGCGHMSYAYARAYANDALWLSLEPPRRPADIERFEFEDLRISQQQQCESRTQSMSDFGTMWGKDAQVQAHPDVGGFVEFEWITDRPGRRSIRLAATAAPDSGRVQASLDGEDLGAPFDLYSGRVSPTGPMRLAQKDVAAGMHRLRITAIGQHPSARGGNFGLDAFELLADREAGEAAP